MGATMRKSVTEEHTYSEFTFHTPPTQKGQNALIVIMAIKVQKKVNTLYTCRLVWKTINAYRIVGKSLRR
jgi:hypothetical protein